MTRAHGAAHPGSSEPRGARLFGIRARRHIAARLHALKVRLADRYGVPREPDLLRELPALPWSPLAAVPGSAERLPWSAPRFWRTAESEALAQAALRHEILLLSPRPLCVDDDAMPGPVGRERLDAELAARRYSRIDWHRDFHSGYRWDPRELYLDVRVGPLAGADIKTPRELSRFQHVGALASAPLDEGAAEFALQVLDWIDANPLRHGVNWACTMDVALRAVNWIWGLRLFEPELARYPAFLREIHRSLRAHGRHIETNLEYYEECTGNHYLSDIAGLCYIGAAFPAMPEADRWLLFAMQELVSEMERTVYSDGGSHEASTSYHRLVGELFASCAALVERLPEERRARLREVDLSQHRVRPRLTKGSVERLGLAAGRAVLPPAFYERLARMAELTAALTKPNGLVPQIGDNDSGRVHKLLQREDDDVRDHRHFVALVGELLGRDDLRTAGRAARAEAEVVAGGVRIAAGARDAGARSASALFPEAGVAVARRGPAYVAVSCGPNGQGGRGGHGHNDKLSFELNVDGRDFIVDGGSLCYTSDPVTRNRYRGTAAHSTVIVPGMEQDAWAPGAAGLFRLPERSRPRLATESDGDIVGAHEGYGAVHRRRFRLTAEALEIEDELALQRERRLCFNLDPAVRCHDLVTEGDAVRCELVHESGASLRVHVQSARAPLVRDGCFSLGYGVRVPSLALEMTMTADRARTRVTW